MGFYFERTEKYFRVRDVFVPLSKVAYACGIKIHMALISKQLVVK